MLILGIETSCDETSIALARVRGSDVEIVVQLTASQIEAHRPFGGVVPEVATRQHLKHLENLTKTLLEKNKISIADVDGIGVTRGPGLAPALLVGLSFGKALALAAKKPWIGVNHLEGHLFSAFLPQRKMPHESHVALIVSGGHTLLIHAQFPLAYKKLGGTLDDAAGEAFDKVAKLLGLPYPGGPQIEKLAQSGDPKKINFPRGMLHSGDFNFSFSGLKTAVRIFLSKNPDALKDEQKKADVCASFQQAVIDVLVEKTRSACDVLRASGVRLFTVSGGVSCNKALRASMEKMAMEENLQCLVAPPHLSTDNAAMIATVAASYLSQGKTSPWDTDIDPNLKL
jgi:N6-L-threonylcarbamoyladenine synthase